MQDLDEAMRKRILTCSICDEAHQYFSAFRASSCHKTCNRGSLGDFLDVPSSKGVVCSTCNTSHSTARLYLEHVDDARLHKDDWFTGCLTCDQGPFHTIRYDSHPTREYLLWIEFDVFYLCLSLCLVPNRH